jgi:hypothetical protein
MADLKLKVTSKTVRETTRFKAAEAVENRLRTAGNVIVRQIKTNIRNQGMIQSRDLYESIEARIIPFRAGSVTLSVGSFGLAYAHINEFGSNNVTDRMRRAMFARMRENGVPKKPGKNVVVGNSFMARPYIRPALDGHSGQIMALMRDAVREFDLMGE